MDKFTKLQNAFDEAEKQKELDKQKQAERVTSIESDLRDAAKNLEKEKKDSSSKHLELEKEKKRADRLEAEIAKIRSEWELQDKSAYPFFSSSPFILAQTHLGLYKDKRRLQI